MDKQELQEQEAREPAAIFVWVPIFAMLLFGLVVFAIGALVRWFFR